MPVKSTRFKTQTIFDGEITGLNEREKNVLKKAGIGGTPENVLVAPSGLTKTELVGVGAQGQENIEIGDNLTLANGKLSASGEGSVSPTLNLMDFSGDSPVARTSITEEEKTNIEKGLYNSVLYMDSSLEETGFYSTFFPECATYSDGDFIFSIYKLSYDETSQSFSIIGTRAYGMSIGEKNSDGTYPIEIQRVFEAPFSGSSGGGSSVNILTGSNLEVVDNGYKGTYSGTPDASKINVLHIPNLGDFVLTCAINGSYTGYVYINGFKFIILLSEGKYTISLDSGLNETPTNVITPGDADNTFDGTLISPGLTLFSAKVPNHSYYTTIPVCSHGHWGAGLSVDDGIDEMTVYTFYDGTKKYETKIYHLKHYSHFITMADSASNVALYLTIQNTSKDEFIAYMLTSYLAGKKVLANGNLHGVIPTYIAGEGGKIKIYYRTPGDNNINPTPDEYQDLSSFTISDLVTPVD